MTTTLPVKTKDVLRYEARRLFARHSYEGVSMRDIAQAVGVRQSAIYNHFASKQDLLVDLMITHMTRMLTGLRAELDGVLDPAKRLEAFIRHHVMGHFDDLDDIFLAYMELRSLEEPGRSTVIGLRKDYERLLKQILADGQQHSGFLIGDPAMMTRAILAMLTGISVWFKEGGPMSREEVTEAYVMATLQMVGLPYAPASAR
jgi:AcrR family transcriptional regulator